MIGPSWHALLFDEDGPKPDAKLRGWLHKRKRDVRPHATSRWTRRYFTLDLDDLELAWYRSKTSINPKGGIGLRSIRSISHIDRSSHMFTVESTERSLTLRATTAELAAYWIRGIRLHIENLKPLVAWAANKDKAKNGLPSSYKSAHPSKHEVADLVEDLDDDAYQTPVYTRKGARDFLHGHYS